MKHIIKERIAELEDMISVRMPLLSCNIAPEERASLENRIRQYEAAIENLFICLRRYDNLTERLVKAGFQYDAGIDVAYWVLSLRVKKSGREARGLLSIFKSCLSGHGIPETVEERITIQGDVHFDNAAVYVDSFRTSISEEEFWNIVSLMEKECCFAVAFRRKNDPEDADPRVYDDYATLQEAKDTAFELTERGYEQVTVFRMRRSTTRVSWQAVEKYRTDKLEQYL